MAELGKRSLERLATCHADLQRLVHAACENAPFDITVICGHRNEVEQQEAFDRGASKLQWPHSKHNSTPSLAVDLGPYPIDWKDHAAWVELRHHVLFTATVIGIRNNIRVISWDWPHFEIING